MTLPVLGRLERVKLRVGWPNEGLAFTPWLASDENLVLLGEAIGLDLERATVEKGVGPFRADILCKDADTDHWVLIENQLESTDHKHLGQLLTYAAGLSAVTIIWIAEKFTEEHRAAIDWLNEVTRDDINFFGLEIELWRINGSPPAPKFNVVSKPNNWTKTLAGRRSAAGSSELTQTRQSQLAFWTQFRDHVLGHSQRLKPHEPHAKHWYNFSIGRSGFRLSAVRNAPAYQVRVGLIIADDNAETYYQLLHQQKEAIEAEMGAALEWHAPANTKRKSIRLTLPNVNPADPAQWPVLFTWLLQTLERFHTVFAPRVKGLDVSSGQPNEAVEDDI